MKEKYAHLEEMKWEEGDIRCMDYPDNTFDVVFDKSTLDAICCADDSFVNIALTLSEIQRVLKVGGTYICISYGCPPDREHHFKREHLAFDLDMFLLNKEKIINDDGEEGYSEHWAYVCEKLPKALELKNFDMSKIN